MDPWIWSSLLLLLGIVLIVLELFLPSGGLLSVLAGLSVLAAIVIAFLGGPQSAVAFLLAALVLLPVTIALAIRWWPHTPLGRRMLGRPADDWSEQDEAELLAEQRRRGLLGRLGRTRSKMLPSGAVLVDGQTYDAVTEGTPLESGQAVRVVAVRGSHLIVRKADEDERDESREKGDVLSQPIESLGLDSFEDPLA